MEATKSSLKKAGGIVTMLSPWQLGSLRVYFKHSLFPSEHAIEIESIGITDKGHIIIEYIQMGQMKKDIIPQKPNEL